MADGGTWLADEADGSRWLADGEHGGRWEQTGGRKSRWGQMGGGRGRWIEGILQMHGRWVMDGDRLVVDGGSWVE